MRKVRVVQTKEFGLHVIYPIRERYVFLTEIPQTFADKIKKQQRYNTREETEEEYYEAVFAKHMKDMPTVFADDDPYVEIDETELPPRHERDKYTVKNGKLEKK